MLLCSLRRSSGSWPLLSRAGMEISPRCCFHHFPCLSRHPSIPLLPLQFLTISSHPFASPPMPFQTSLAPFLCTSYPPQRGGALIKKWGRSSAASTAVSVVDAIKSLTTPTPEGDWFSSGVG